MGLSVKRSLAAALLFVVVSFLAITLGQQQLFTRRTRAEVAHFNSRFVPNGTAREVDLRAYGDTQTASGSSSDYVFFMNMILPFFNYATLYRGYQEHLIDPFNYIHPSFNLNQIVHFGPDIDVIGVLSVPAIDLELPVYLGASHHNLNRGLAHLMHSSFPVGGDNTHAVIAGHRRVNHARVFQNIELLELGDEIRFTNFYQTLIYTVIDTNVISPGQTDLLIIQSDRDLISLVTQYSNGFNRADYRLVVTAERVGVGPLK